ncbi:MAG: M20/M25/M40 family metallo-hydrolase, partial [Nitrospirales bacterium]|nr:M20/M25/M40 family metallo-hydrolase [Nitrospirales bacterium]
RQVIDDPRVVIRKVGVAREPSIESDINSWAFQALQRTIGEVFPEALFAPYLLLGGTDSYHYRNLAPKSIYRFSPIWLKPADLPRIHGANERISIANYELGIHFYHQLIRNLDL